MTFSISTLGYWMSLVETGVGFFVEEDGALLPAEGFFVGFRLFKRVFVSGGKGEIEISAIFTSSVIPYAPSKSIVRDVSSRLLCKPYGNLFVRISRTIFRCHFKSVKLLRNRNIPIWVFWVKLISERKSAVWVELWDSYILFSANRLR